MKKETTSPPSGRQSALDKTVADLIKVGLADHQQGRLDKAEKAYRDVLLVKPRHFDALQLLATIVLQRGDPLSAVKLFDQALKIRPTHAHALNNRGNALRSLLRLDEALASYNAALSIKPDYFEVLNNRGAVLADLHRPVESLESYRRALEIKPTEDFLYGFWLYSKLKLCDWSDVENQIALVCKRIESDERVLAPFPFLAISNSPLLQQKAAQILVSAKHPFIDVLPTLAGYPTHDKIRIGYFSADFHDHPGSFLMAGLFEMHDRSKFEVIAFSFGPVTQDEMQKRVSGSFDRFIDVRTMSDKDVALLARQLEIDIAIDRKGFTRSNRTGIFALRAAPIQVSYLAYPGTMGADYIDYLIADPVVIPKADQDYYSEKIAYLPHSYQVNDDQRKIADRTFSRAELGLPEAGFVFCCFNNNYKILPQTFDGWMRILRQVEGSVLWLLEDNPTAAANLRKEAERRGISGERLVFAPRMPLAEHLARHRAADLFIDTLPYNAHTTASDALWAGLPVLTCLGQTFAGRVAASLLNAIELPELITTTPEAFEALAVELATHPEKLAKIKQKLAANRLTTPLFNCRQTTRDIEALFTAMVQRYRAGLPPDHIELVGQREPDKGVAATASDRHQLAKLNKREAKPAQPKPKKSGAGGGEQGAPTAQAIAAKLKAAVALHQQGKLDQAEQGYNEILRAQPENFDALQLLATIALQRKKFSIAIGKFDQALAINPKDANVLNNRGVALGELRRYAEAIDSWHRALKSRPNFVDALNNLGSALRDLKRHEEALESYLRALTVDPKRDYLFGNWLFTKMKLCVWDNVQGNIAELEQRVGRNESASPPFQMLVISNKRDLQNRAAQMWVAAKCPPNNVLGKIAKRTPKQRVHIGYFSGDFHNHATSYLMAELFERHDRSRFEVTAFSFGPDANDQMRRRVVAGFDSFVNVRQQSDKEVVTLARHLGIDIAVDLKGFGQDSRTGIFALRAAPIQVNYLVYPGTMGAEYMDYLIADATLIPESDRSDYVEKIAYLPNSYQVNDTTRQIDDTFFTRAELGLPDTGFVYCCFNNSYKITPGVFNTWMRILTQVHGSVLWLLEESPSTSNNLRAEAKRRGIDESRLIFAPRMPLPMHLSRHRVADLFLDTLPCNAHTTASDALWAGLPVLTCLGETFSGRVAASLLNAIELPELITTTQDAYEALAVELATAPDLLARVKQKLADNRLTTSLFNCRQTTRDIEALFMAMYQRYLDDLPPEVISVSNVGEIYPGSPSMRTIAKEAKRSNTTKSEVAALLERALTNHRQGQLELAEHTYNAILKSEPEHFDALQLLATIRAQQGESHEAVKLFDKALTLRPEHVQALNNRGNALRDLKRYDEALSSYGLALQVMPDFVDALSNRASILRDLNRFDEALDCYDRVMEIAPMRKFLLGNWLNIKMKLCDWHKVDARLIELAERINRNESASPPFPVLAISDSRRLQKLAAEHWVHVKYPLSDTLPPIAKRARHDKIRLGYFSADFRSHPVSILTAELFERHDKSRFELIAISFAPDDGDQMTRRIAKAFDQFVDVRTLSDIEVATMARELELDIAIDLGGFTAQSRAGIFALRAAPIQVSYLGYLGTMGANYIDYLIADPVLIPAAHRKDYTEKIAYLPDSFQANDTKRKIANRVFTRTELGLPMAAFVFCCFNNNYKITQGTFDSWMRILKRVEGSVLWLYQSNPVVAKNLQKEAIRRGVDAERLIFAKHAPAAEYLARYRAADLFLDTLPYNAGTTASDALWVGLPVLTCIGETFAGRVAASLLSAIDLPELIASSLVDYENLAVELAASPEKLANIKQKLVDNRLTMPLFDCQRFTRNIETLFNAMYERYLADLRPDDLVTANAEFAQEQKIKNA